MTPLAVYDEIIPAGVDTSGTAIILASAVRNGHLTGTETVHAK